MRRGGTPKDLEDLDLGLDEPPERRIQSRNDPGPPDVVPMDADLDVAPPPMPRREVTDPGRRHDSGLRRPSSQPPESQILEREDLKRKHTSRIARRRRRALITLSVLVLALGCGTTATVGGVVWALQTQVVAAPPAPAPVVEPEVRLPPEPEWVPVEKGLRRDGTLPPPSSPARPDEPSPD